MRRGKFTALDAYAEKEKASISNFIFYHKYQKKKKKKEQANPKACRQKERTKIRQKTEKHQTEGQF